MRTFGLFTICLFILVWVSGCPKRDAGIIDVDAIQGYVDTIDTHLKKMYQALKDKDLDEAEDQYEDAQEEFADNRAQLVAYPEVELVKERMTKAESDLCYGFVDINVQLCYAAIHARDVDEARSKLEESREENQRCRAKIETRDDYMPLKMNLDGAPQSLADLVAQLALEALRKRIQEFAKDLEPDIQKVRSQLASLKSNPNQRDLAQETDRDIREIRSELQSRNGFGDDAEWVALAASLSGELDEMAKLRSELVRRGKILFTVENLLPQASMISKKALAVGIPVRAVKLHQAALKRYKECEEMVSGALQEDASLAKFTFRLQGSTRDVRWLQKHCGSQRQKAEKMITSLSSKKSPAKKTKKKKAPKKVLKKTQKKKEKKTGTKKPRSRIRRW